MADVKRDLPRGMGYKCSWMVVEGATQKNVAEAFLQGRKMKYTYEAGLEKLTKSGAKEKRLMVTGTYKKQNYVIGDEVGAFFYETEEFLEKCKSFSRVYVYMTHRVSETHGFALVENGQLVRLFCYDENEIKNIGEPLPEEIELGYKLPANFEETRDEEFTTVNEDLIMELALCQVGIDVEKYPYKDVKMGKRFEYSGELAANPYPRDDEEIPEEMWSMPVVQRLKACNSWKERLLIVEEVKDTLTHPMIDVFGEIMEVYPSYCRLSDRIDELHCMVRDAAHYEEISISKVKFLLEINKGTQIFEGLVFEKFSLENFKCDKLTLINCLFLDMTLTDIQIEHLECKKCSFRRTEISGKLIDAFISMENTSFDYCDIHDLEINGQKKQAEWRDCKFTDCTFGNIKISADLSIYDGWFWSCKGKQIECNITQITEMFLQSDKFEDVKISADVIKNRFVSVEIENMQGNVLDKESFWKENKFSHQCKINGEIRSDE